MKRIHADQIAYKMNRAEKSIYEDVSKATEALKWMVEKIESYLNKCLNVENVTLHGNTMTARSLWIYYTI
jgi:hypothetical protein